MDVDQPSTFKNDLMMVADRTRNGLNRWIAFSWGFLGANAQCSLVEYDCGSNGRWVLSVRWIHQLVVIALVDSFV